MPVNWTCLLPSGFDTTAADGHDLAFGLATAAVQTGGYYASTYRFVHAAVARLERTLSGRYELELRVPPTLKPGAYALTFRVKRRGAVILAPTTVVVR